MVLIVSSVYSFPQKSKPFQTKGDFELGGLESGMAISFLQIGIRHIENAIFMMGHESENLYLV